MWIGNEFRSETLMNTESIPNYPSLLLTLALLTLLAKVLRRRTSN